VIEFFGNHICFTPVHMTYTTHISSLYGVFAWVVHARGGEWMYPFLAYEEWSSIAVYSALLVAHLIAYGFWYLLDRFVKWPLSDQSKCLNCRKHASMLVPEDEQLLA